MQSSYLFHNTKYYCHFKNLLELAALFSNLSELNVLAITSSFKLSLEDHSNFLIGGVLDMTYRLYSLRPLYPLNIARTSSSSRTFKPLAFNWGLVFNSN